MNTSLRVGALIVVGIMIAGTTFSPAQTGERQQKAPTVEKSKHRGWLGVSIGDAKSGARVNGVTDESPADAAGIKEEDVIVEFNNKTIADADDLVAAVRKTAPGETVNVVVIRDKQKKSLQVKVGKLPSIERQLSITVPHPPLALAQKDLRMARVFGNAEPLGLRLMELNSQLGEYFGAPDGKGVLVERVKGKSAAAKAGFKAGDVILRIGKEDIEEKEDVYSAMEDYEEGDTITVQILRKGASLTLAVMAPEQENRNNLFFRYRLHELPEPDSHLMWFNQDKFRGDMERLKEELRNLGQEIKTKMKDVQMKLQQELRQVGT